MQTYNKAPEAIQNSADVSLNCCGFYENGTLPTLDAGRCQKNTDLECTNFGKLNATGNCDNCRDKVEDKVDSAFNASGGLGLFFSFTEVSLVWRKILIMKHYFAAVWKVKDFSNA